MLDPKDAEASPCPHLCLASKDEPVEAVKQVKEILEKRGDGSYATTYSESIHGWMGARCNLDNKAEQETFQRGYKEAVKFFASHL